MSLGFSVSGDLFDSSLLERGMTIVMVSSIVFACYESLRINDTKG